MKSAKFRLALTIVAGLTASLLNAQSVLHVKGTISEDTQWSADIIMVDSTVDVDRYATLTIKPGTYIEFQGYYPLNIYGRLRASGSDAKPIVFTMNDTTGFSNTAITDGAWNGIRFDGKNQEDTSILEHCTVEFCKAITGDWYGIRGGAIDALGNTNLIVRNCIIRNNYATMGGGGLFLYDSETWITGNEIYNNVSDFRGGGITAWNGSHQITGNRIFNNYAPNGGGINVDRCDPLIANNIICNNEAYLGGGITLLTAEIVCMNNTICNNKANTGGGMYLNLQRIPVFYNNIVWGNEGDQFFLPGINPVVSFYNNNIQGGKEAFGLDAGSLYFGEYLENIDTLPGFTSPSSGAGIDYDGIGGDWTLMAVSPCINKGSNEVGRFGVPETDVISNRRISYSTIDIGAYEFNRPSMDAVCLVDEDMTWTADTIKVSCDMTINDGSTLTINPGAIVQFQGSYKMDIRGALQALGTATDSIIFTIKDTTGFSDLTTNTGGWGGLNFQSFATNDSSKILYSRIEYGKKISGGELRGGGIYAASTYRLLISNSIITNCIGNDGGGGIYLTGSPVTLLNSTISHNRALVYWGGGMRIDHSNARIIGCNVSYNSGPADGGGIFCYFSNPIIKNSWITHNSVPGTGGGIYARYYSEPVISGNVISYNTSGSGGGISLSTSSAYLDNNLISNNLATTGGGISVYSDELILINNIISNNSAQNSVGGISIAFEQAVMINNTIVNNRAENRYCGLSVSSPGLVMMNTILWGNTDASGDKQISVSGNNYPDIYNCNFQGGLESLGFSEPSQYPGIFQGNLDSLPHFVRPTDSSGIGWDGLAGDWALMATSPSINSGNPETGSYEVLPGDFSGNPRIHGSVIDMGAIENQDGPPVVNEHPLNYTRCTGDSLILSVRVTNDAVYQWQLNQADIPGATGSEYKIDSVSQAQQGNYQCIIHNSYATVRSNPALLQVNSPPKLLLEPEDTWSALKRPSNLKALAVGTEPEYQWRHNGMNLPGKILNELIIQESDYPHEGFYDCIVHNSCGSDTTGSAELYIAPNLCMVTVSSETGNNLVVWEKKSQASILAYNVYRESVAAGIYDLLATVPYDDLSAIEDTEADPTVQAYLYKITAVLDTNMNETDIDLCKPHKTIYLQVTTNPENNRTQLEWDRYYGFDYQTYTIYRSSNGTSFDSIGSISANNSGWTDPEQLSGDLFYRITVRKPDPCYPTGGGKKAGTGPYHHSLSNMDDNKLKSGQLPPDTITITNHSILEESSPGTMIGKLITEDKDTADSHNYKFVQGEGDEDNLSFTLLGDLLFSSVSFDFETKAQHAIRIRSTDEAGNYCEVPFIIQVLDIDETTGIPLLTEGTVKAFPNPFSHETTIRFPNTGNGSYRMTLTTLSGKLVRMQYHITTGDFLLKRDGLENGLYLIELKGEKTYRGKLIIE